MSGSKSSFNDDNKNTEGEYHINKILEKTCIVQNSIGEYYIAKKFYATDTYALNQIGLMKTIRHPNIVACHDIIMEKGRIYLIEEYCQEGDLAYYIKNQIKKKKCYFSEKTVSKWLLQILLAIQYLHNKKIMHRDIRPQNIFLTSLGNVKLGSFRSSKMYYNEFDLSATVIGSPYYMAPECVEGRGYDQKVDIWAFGCLLYEICTLKFMFSNKNIVEQAQIILKGVNKDIPSIYSKQLSEIYTKCLTKNSNQRPSAKSLIRENYFLEKMKNFVTEKPESILRIPIKHYNVHFNILANKKQEKDVNKLKQTLKLKKKINDNRVHTPMLPKIEQNCKSQRRNSFQKSKLPKQPPKSVQLVKPKSIQKVKESIRERSKQIIRQSSRERQKSRECIRKKSVNKAEKFIVYSPVQRRKSIDPPDSSQKKVSVEKGKKIEKIKTEDSIESPKSFLLPPPLLPRPPQKKTQRKQVQKHVQTSQPLDFSDTKKKEDLAVQLLNFRHDPQQKFNKDEIKSSLTKIFDDLHIKQDEQQQFSFELEDQNLARLTMKPNQGNQLIQTYKTKLEQLVEQINYKYCPILQPIAQRTQQFDSNTFASIRKQ